MTKVTAGKMATRSWAAVSAMEVSKKEGLGSLVGIRTPAKNTFCAWLVQNKGDPKKAKSEKGELILGKEDKEIPFGSWTPLPTSILRVDETLHHFETIASHCWLVFTGDASRQGF